MKLVEILARELDVWPERVKALEQMAMGEIIEAGNCAKVFCVTEKADFPEIVTQPQWQAERDRMKAMEKIEQGIKQFENDVDSLARIVGAPLSEPTYEQQLWDRVAERAFFRMVDLEIESSQGHTIEFIAKFGSDHADAFMAERAKRVGK